MRNKTVSELKSVTLELKSNPPLHSQQNSMVELFAAQVKRCGAATAVQYGTEALSYHELDRRSNQLAHYLRRLGVGPEVRVGVG